jgi:hypothetical protein
VTDIPADAQRSNDGQWWWDGTQWQPVSGGGGGGQAGGGGEGKAEFGFDWNGLGVQVDQGDNPDHHVNLHVNAGTEVMFTVCNTGTVAGTATVTISVDDQQVQTWTSGNITAGQCAGTNVSGCGRQSAGSRKFSAVVTPGHSGSDTATNTVDIGDS